MIQSNFMKRPSRQSDVYRKTALEELKNRVGSIFVESCVICGKYFFLRRIETTTNKTL